MKLKKKCSKRLTALLLCVLLQMTLVPAAAAESTEAQENPAAAKQTQQTAAPKPGEVQVGKTAAGVSFDTTAAAKVELTVQGTPVVHKKDVVVVVDMSSSMRDSLSGGQARIDVLRNSLGKLVDTLARENGTVATGSDPLTRVAIVGFNNYDYQKISTRNTVSYQSGNENGDGFNHGNNILTGSKNAAGAFVSPNARELTNDIAYCTSGNCHSGTNYDLALQTTYEVLNAAKKTAGYDREQYVIFMSDGAPFQYNYFRGFSGNGQPGKGVDWMAWMGGDETNGAVANLLTKNAVAPSYFETNGKLRWAEAIKGTGENYQVIDPYNGSKQSSYIKTVAGLGATVYSIGFCLAQDGEITVKSEQQVLTRLSSGSGCFYQADSADDLKSVFGQIASCLAYAATNAAVTDVIGSAYSLLTDGSIPCGTSNMQTYLKEAPYIAIGIRSKDEQGNAVYQSLEKVVLSKDSVIQGENFTYDTASKTFTWNIGTLRGNQQYVITYFVQLTGALEGTRAAGTYATNEKATLAYTDYVGVAQTKNFPVPSLDWKDTAYSYEFYLVNANGQPIDETGKQVNFADRTVFFSQKVAPVCLNSDNAVQPDISQIKTGYELYSADTAGFVRVGSGENASHVYIRDKGTVQTTRLDNETAAYTKGSITIGGSAYTAEASGMPYSSVHFCFGVVQTVETVSRTVTKSWADTEETHDAVTMQLYANGETYGGAVTLNEENGWTYTWPTLQRYVYENGVPTKREIDYTMKETPIPDHYYVSYQYDDEGNCTVINTPVTNQILTLPSTGGGGMFIYAVSGTALLLTGGAWLVLTRRKQAQDTKEM